MKRLTKWTGCVFLPVAILFLVALLKWETLSYFMLKKGMEFYAGREHIALDVGEIKGRLFSATTVNNVTIHPAEGKPQEYHLKAGSIACTYNLWDLKKGFEFFISGLHCSISDTVFSYDFAIKTPEEKPDEDGGNDFVPAILPGLTLKNIAVMLSHPLWDAEIGDLDGMLLSPAEKGHELRLEAGSVRFRHEGITKVTTPVRMVVGYKDARLSIDFLEAGDEELSVNGFIDLAGIDEGYSSFALNMAFAESLLNVSGSAEKWLLQARIVTDTFDVGELQKRLGGSEQNMHGIIRGTVDLAYNLNSMEALEGSFDFTVQDGQVNGVAVDTVAISGSFDRELFRVSLAEASTPDNHISFIDVSVPMALLQDEDVLAIIRGGRAQLTVNMSDVPSFLKLFKVEGDMLSEALRPHSLIIEGHLEKGALHLDSLLVEVVDSILTIQEATIPIPETAQDIDSIPIRLKARFESRSIEKFAGLFSDIPLIGQLAVDIGIHGSIKEPVASIDLSGENLSFRELPLGSLELKGEVMARQETPGKLDSLEFAVTELTQTNNSGTLALLNRATGIWQPEKFALSATFQLDKQGEIVMRADRHPGEQITARITTGNLDSRGWLNVFINDGFYFQGAAIEAVFKGLPLNPELHLTGRVDQAGSDEVPFPFTGRFVMDYSQEGIVIEEFDWSSHDRNKMTLTGYLPYDPLSPEPFIDRQLSLKGSINFPVLEDIAFLLKEYGLGKGAVSLDLDLRGSWEQPAGHILLQAREIEPLGALKEYLGPTFNVSGEITAKGESVILKAANLESTSYSAKAAGSWKHGQSVKEILQRGTAALEGEVWADATVEMRDLNFLRRRISGLRRVEGEMEGKIHIAGPVTGPSLQGSFFLRDGEVSHTFNFPMLSDLNLQGTFDENSITINDLQAELGGSPVSLKGMIVRKGEKSNVSLNLDGSNVLLFRNSDMRIRGNVQLDVSGPLERLVISGTTGLTGGYYTKNFDFLSMIGSSSKPLSEGSGFLFSFPDAPLRDAVFDIKITSIEPFRIKNSLIRGALRPEMFLKGTGELPFLVGTVYIDPSKVLLPSGKLQVQSGLLRFLEGEPDRPQLDLLAQSKVLDYDITMITRGPIDDPVVTLSSSPSLPSEDLLLLLLTGQLPRDQVRAGAESMGATNIIVYLGRDFVNKWLEDDSAATDETILDRFELDIGRGITKSGEQTVESRFRLSKELSGTGTVYYLTGEKDKYDAYNYGLKMVFRLE